MTDQAFDANAGAAQFAHLGAISGPLIPLAVWLVQRRQDPFAAEEARKATNWGVTVAVVFIGSTLVRMFVPLVSFIGTIGQAATAVVAVYFSIYAFRNVRSGVTGSYPASVMAIRPSNGS